MKPEQALTDGTLYWCCGRSNDTEQGDYSLTEPKRVRIVEDSRHGGVVREWVRVGDDVADWKSCNRGLVCTRDHDPSSQWGEDAPVFLTEREAWDYYDASREQQLRGALDVAVENLTEFLSERQVRRLSQRLD